MDREFHVIDLHIEGADPEPKIVLARTAEKAAALVLGVELVRSGHRRDLRAKVYYQPSGQPTTMVRLYTKVADRTGA